MACARAQAALGEEQNLTRSDRGVAAPHTPASGSSGPSSGVGLGNPSLNPSLHAGSRSPLGKGHVAAQSAGLGPGSGAAHPAGGPPFASLLFAVPGSAEIDGGRGAEREAAATGSASPDDVVVAVGADGGVPTAAAQQLRVGPR